MSRRAWWAFAVMSVTWGASYLLIKIGIEGGMPAPDVAWLRVAMAAVILVVLAWRAGAMGTLRGRWRWVAGYAVAEISIPFPLIAAGEVHIASSLAAIIIAAVPLIVTVLSLRFDPSERPTPLRAVGLAVGFAGVIALVGIDVAGSGPQVLGAVAVLVGAIGYAVGPMLVKLGMDGIDSRAAMGGSLVIATVILAPFAALDLPSRTPTVGALAAVAALGVFCTAMAFVVYTVLVREAGTGRATIITYVNPLVAVVLGVSLLGERPGPGALAGLAMILAGSWLSTGGRLPPRGPLGPGRRRGDTADPQADLAPAQSV
ncbi:MAG TPA: EamA family transporter [Solirubrobacteraceae bacterium]|jgi:drug/metabolite transporter (DMT)-like permease|nr:EamA family transporter [Solirubrobacteraceae bacterium]